MCHWFRIAACALLSLVLSTPQSIAREVVAFWGFADDYSFPETANKLGFAADVDNTAGTNANLQAYLGDAEDLDENGGGGFTSCFSPTSGVTYAPTRTVKWDDLKGGGDDFDINGTTEFLVDKNDGNGPVTDEFGNDALIYITLNGTGYRDFEVRFDVEGTPGDLPTTFDIFYRTGGTGTWFREFAQDDIPLNFQDYDPIDPENQFADSGVFSLSASLNGQSQIELIINDFDEFGNDELEIDNIEITANVIPEPASLAIAIVGGVVVCGLRRTR